MPLREGKSQATISHNIEVEKRANPDMSNEQAAAIAYAMARRSGTDNETARQIDRNGFVEIQGNPISKVGVFPYRGSQISPELEPDKIYQVYRPKEELDNEDTMKSFRLLPWTDEHAMLGDADEGMMPAEQKGVHGVIGENVYFEDGYLKANLKVFSQKLAELIDGGKKELSIGYRCLYDIESGVYNGERYDVVQRQIRGNHIALVGVGRSGRDVAVLDSFKITLDAKDVITMSKKPVSAAADEDAISLESLNKKVDALAEAVGELKMMERKEDKEMKAGDVEPKDFVKKAEVTDEDKDDEKKKEDAKDEEEDLKKKGEEEAKKESKGMDTKAFLREVSQRDALASKLSQHIGTFDHAEKTLQEVAEYGVNKLKLACVKGHECSVLDGYLAGAKVQQPVRHVEDEKPSSMIDAYLKGSK